MINERILCRDHLMGEHKELHMLAGHIRLGRRLGKYASEREVEPLSIHTRHAQISLEMLRRGYNHKSPLEHVSLEGYPHHEQLASVDRAASFSLLIGTCDKCFQRWAGDQTERKRVRRIKKWKR